MGERKQDIYSLIKYILVISVSLSLFLFCLFLPSLAALPRLIVDPSLQWPKTANEGSLAFAERALETARKITKYIALLAFN